MSEHSSEEIVRLAQERVATRRAEEQGAARADAAERPSRERGWRLAFAALLGALLLGLLAWPGLPLNWKMYAAVHGVCAQIHNVEVGGAQLPLCARNTGIYASFLTTVIYLALLGRGRAGNIPPIPITITLVLLVAIMAVDGFNSMLRDMFLPHLYVPRNELRTLTGIGMGTALGVMLLLIMNLALRRDVDRSQRVLGSWLELGGALLVNLAAWGAIYGNVGVLYWPVAVTAWLGIVGILFCVNLLVAAVALGYEGAVVRVADLARPGTIALMLTTVELALLAWARFGLEAQGVVMS
jgi:uncharacterized membrane protein